MTVFLVKEFELIGEKRDSLVKDKIKTEMLASKMLDKKLDKVDLNIEKTENQ